jgi:hypothetical protein
MKVFRTPQGKARKSLNLSEFYTLPQQCTLNQTQTKCYPFNLVGYNRASPEH